MENTLTPKEFLKQKYKQAFEKAYNKPIATRREWHLTDLLFNLSNDHVEIKAENDDYGDRDISYFLFLDNDIYVEITVTIGNSTGEDRIVWDSVAYSDPNKLRKLPEENIKIILSTVRKMLENYSRTDLYDPLKEYLFNAI